MEKKIGARLVLRLIWKHFSHQVSVPPEKKSAPAAGSPANTYLHASFGAAQERPNLRLVLIFHFLKKTDLVKSALENRGI